jgi:hypothetical protein
MGFRSFAASRNLDSNRSIWLQIGNPDPARPADKFDGPKNWQPVDSQDELDTIADRLN